ncbi:MAG TPA: heavy metal-binding domain-containing protein [Vicinamibacterales bacterium]
MRFRLGVAVLLAAATGSVAPAAQTKTPAAPTKTAAPAQQKMPVSYVCTMPGDEDVVEDKPGACPKCKMTLQAVRIEQAWACGNNTSIIRANPGKCPVDGRDLVPVTVAHFFDCGEKPAKYYPDAGKCADGAARVERREIRAHGDHNPVHGGQFYMAADNWHHVEGTYPSTGLFRAFFYDNFKKPLPGKNFSGELIVLDKSDKELATLPLTPSRDGNTLEAKLPQQLATMPLKAAATIQYDPKAKAQRFDFVFTELSKDPGPAKPAPTTTGAAAPAKPAASGAKPAAPATASKAPATPSPAAPAAADASSQEPLILDTPLQIPPALADALDETRLPSGTPELLAELTKRAGDVEQLVNEGNLSQVWLPATATKTVALVLETHANSLPERQRVAVSDSVKRVVTSAWELDAYGDLGDRKKITEAYQRMATAVGDLKAAYGK